VLIGVQDTGLGVNSSGYIHPDLRGSDTLLYPNNYRDDFSSSPESHGTGVQGIIAAKSNNGSGMSGINWNSKVFHIDVLGGNSNDQSLAQATQNMINFANSQGQRLVINMSLGSRGSFGWTGVNSDFLRVVDNNPNVLFVIAAGNDGHRGITGISDPAILAYYRSNVIAVGASWGTQDRVGIAKTPGQRIQYNNFWGSQYGPGLTLMGPSEVISTKAVLSASGTQFGYYTSGDRFNGTSAAAPNVAGVASLVWSANRNLTASQIKEILSRTAFDLGAQGYDIYYGNGFVNADAAVRRALALTRTGVSSLTSAQNPDSYRPMPSADNFAQNGSAQVATTDLVGEALKSGNHQTFFQRPMFDDFDLMTVTAQKIGLGEDIFQSESNLSKDLVNNQLAANTSLEATKSSTLQDAPDYFAGYDIITGMAHLSKLAGLNSQLFEVLEPGIDVYPALAKNVDELVLTHA
jgi:subtilisin family serine protease